MTHLLQRKVVPPIVGEVLRQPGRELDSETRRTMSVRFGHDFGRVRVHDDARAGESAMTVGAAAYTVGPHIVFRPSLYQPATQQGARLLAHELAHVMQQPATVTLPDVVSEPGDRREREADALADQALHGALHDRPPLHAEMHAAVLQRQVPAPGPDCDDLLTRIIARVIELKERAAALITNPLNLPQSGPMSIDGHQQQFRNKQINLRRLLQDWDTNNCGPGLPSDAWNWATRPVPAPRPVAPPSTSTPRTGDEITTQDVVDTAAKGVTAAATLYIAYRVVRMLPSLLPPLWWTIPANAVAP